MLLRAVSLTVVAAAFVGLASARAWAQGDGPQVGDLAPDFSLPGASKAGVTEKALRLADFRGQTVVISFFPKARTKGWTVQHEAYRDQYATIFNGGKGVVALSISADGADELASWAKDANFPMLFASDTTGDIAEKYATTGTGIGPLKKFYKRVVFVVGPDGRVVHVFRPFSALSQDQYAQLDSVIDVVSKTVK